MYDLPFKVRKHEAPVIYASKEEIPERVRSVRLGNDALVYKGKIYVFRKDIPKYAMEHEKAHIHIPSSKLKTPHMATGYIDDEVKADLLTFQRTGKPKSLYPDYFDSRLEDLVYVHTNNDTGEGNKYNLYETYAHCYDTLKRIYYKYWNYLPEQWKEDWNKYKNSVESDLDYRLYKGEHMRPPGDYKIQLSRSRIPVIRKRRVIRQPDRMTGFMISRAV